MDNEVGRISRSLYGELNKVIGSPLAIHIRRTTTEFRDEVDRMYGELTGDPHVHCFSGSKAEGLRFKSSDEDWMLIYKQIKVIPSDSYTALYDCNTTLLLMENEMTKPGFTLLRPRPQEFVTNKHLTEYNSILNRRFLSCKRWRENLGGYHQYGDDQFIHGPCASGTLKAIEYDVAHCLQCDIWPNNAQDCIKRLHQCGWPSHSVVDSIVNDGVLFVPIGAKGSIFENIEWRMSFSLAEKKLIHSMNHTQFLCYGLLKIFLKEIIDENLETRGLLCSYFLKTAVFWEITTTSNQWNPSTLMSCFWNCFRQLIQWVSCAYCPNFFIPQNNMFEGKVEGTNQDKLLQHLKALYYDGHRCLLRCPSLSDMSCVVNEGLNIRQIEWENCVYIAMYIISEYYNLKLSPVSRPYDSIGCVLMYKLMNTSNNSHQHFLLRSSFKEHITGICRTEFNNSSAQGGCNKSNYKILIKRLHVLQRFSIDAVSHTLDQAMLCYNAGKYNQTLRLIQHSKKKIFDPNSMCINRINMDVYKKAGGEDLAIETMMRKHILYNVFIRSQCFPEFCLEVYSEYTDISKTGIDISPLVYAFFLQFLCQRRLGCQGGADEALYELSLLLQHDRKCIDKSYHGISWQILGVCQQMNGDDRAACRSYVKGVQQTDITVNKKAASIRLGTMLVKYIWQSMAIDNMFWHAWHLAIRLEFNVRI